MSSSAKHAAGWPQSTRWSLVKAAAGPDAPGFREALETLCATYWYPLYAYARRKGHDRETAADLTQEFFAILLEKGILVHWDPQRGKFRSFLKAAFDHFRSNEIRRRSAQRRGGDRRHWSLDAEVAEHRYLHEPVDGVTPERLYERNWALTVVEVSLGELRQEYVAAGKAPWFDHFKPYLVGDENPGSYKELGERLGKSAVAVKVEVHRLRQRCRALICAQIAHTVERPEDVTEELDHLFDVLGH
jgi:RNA polymerase sigma-70 factor (ECF subfamily)